MLRQIAQNYTWHFYAIESQNQTTIWQFMNPSPNPKTQIKLNHDTC